MGFVFEARTSDSPYIEGVTHGWAASTAALIRPAECHWHMVFARVEGRLHPIVVGPLRTSGVVMSHEGVELLWLKFRLGTYMPHLPVKHLLDTETPLPSAGSDAKFWLHSAAWQPPSYDNVETFVARLVRDGALCHDPVVAAALAGQPDGTPARTVRHRFRQVTGLTQTDIFQHGRAQRAADLLRRGVGILDTVEEAGYFDQPHLTRALKRWVGHTPAQLVRGAQHG
ncbi:MAG: AraC family transcriptional regulator [Anaerolineae bacterium]|nr:AraC family transcriptional regulator [Anaerolineae bacterium]